MDRYTCIRGHFYQPPRENPWLEDVQLRDSAYPFHDWNACITCECYRQNASSRILGTNRKILDIVNNYSSISFDYGPALLSWLESHAPNVYQKVLEADRLGQGRFTGHGPAIAEPYNHVILPLCDARDRLTQVLWDMRDFERRFGRRPEGMWLPETAAAIQCLEPPAEQGIRFTILASRQARRIRRGKGQRWRNVSEQSLDTSVPYKCTLPSGRSIAVFFYDGRISQDIAYGGLLHSGENLAARLAGAFPVTRDCPRLVSVAPDGGSFGHHHRYRDMALAYCLHHIMHKGLAGVTIYAEYLDKVSVEHEVEILDNSSWSCAHGVERWRSNCGCCSPQSLSGQQGWRAQLRDALDWIRDQFAARYERLMGQFNPDPRSVRDDYISVITDRSGDHVEAFINQHVGRELTTAEKVTFLKLLEIQRHAMLMYTSCGWFFDRICGIETVQILQYACKALQLHREVHQQDLEPRFKQRLEAVPKPGQPRANGGQVYEAYVEPSRIDLNRVAAHVAMSWASDSRGHDRTDTYCYQVKTDSWHGAQVGVQVLITGSAHVQSKVRLEHADVDLAVLYLGDHHLFGAVRPRDGHEAFVAIQGQLCKAFHDGNANEVMRLMANSLGGMSYSLLHLFKDEQRGILDQLLEKTCDQIEGSYRNIYEHNCAIMHMLDRPNMLLPAELAGAAAFVVNHDILRELRCDPVNPDRLGELVGEAVRFGLPVDPDKIGLEASRLLNAWMHRLEAQIDNVRLLEQITSLLENIRRMVPETDLRHAQNTFFRISRSQYPLTKGQAQSNETEAVRWVGQFMRLAGYLDLALA